MKKVCKKANFIHKPQESDRKFITMMVCKDIFITKIVADDIKEGAKLFETSSDVFNSLLQNKFLQPIIRRHHGD
jgi:hypothetical protein